MTDMYFFGDFPIAIDPEKFEQLAAVERTQFVLMATEAGHGARLPALLGLADHVIERIGRQRLFMAPPTDEIEDVLPFLKPTAWKMLTWLRDAGTTRITYADLCALFGVKADTIKTNVARLRREELIDFSSKGREGIRLAITARGISALESRDA